MPPARATPIRSRFRSPDGKIRLYGVVGGAPATHAVFCRRRKGDGWFLNKGYESREAAVKAIAAIDPAWVIDVDYVIVEREPV